MWPSAKKSDDVVAQRQTDYNEGFKDGHVSGKLFVYREKKDAQESGIREGRALERDCIKNDIPWKGKEPASFSRRK
jgi:hypothetical protein